MNETQTSLLIALAKRLEKAENSKEISIKTLNSAGIVTKKGEISKSFPNLARILAAAE